MKNSSAHLLGFVVVCLVMYLSLCVLSVLHSKIKYTERFFILKIFDFY